MWRWCRRQGSRIQTKNMTTCFFAKNKTCRVPQPAGLAPRGRDMFSFRRPAPAGTRHVCFFVWSLRLEPDEACFFDESCFSACVRPGGARASNPPEPLPNKGFPSHSDPDRAPRRCRPPQTHRHFALPGDATCFFFAGRPRPGRALFSFRGPAPAATRHVYFFAEK